MNLLSYLNGNLMGSLLLLMLLYDSLQCMLWLQPSKSWMAGLGRHRGSLTDPGRGQIENVLWCKRGVGLKVQVRRLHRARCCSNGHRGR